MKQGWEIKKLGEICSFERGLTYAKGDEVATSSKGVLRSNNIDLTTNSLNYDEIKYLREDFEIPTKKMVRKNSLLMCISNGSKIHLGKVALIKDDIDYAFGGFMGLLTPNEAIIHPRYFYYALISPAYKMLIKGLSDGANINNLKFADLQSFDIPIPSLEEQERIVEILVREFEKIDALKENAEKNLQHAKDLFQSVLKQELQPKEGWERCKLCEVCTFYNGKPHENDIDENGEYILVNSKFISSDMQVYKKTSSQFFPLFAGDIVMVMSDVPNGKALAKCQIIQKDNLYSLNQRICVFRDAKIDVKLLYYLVNRNPYLIAFDNGENQTNLRKNDIVSMPICHPTNTKEVAGIVARLDYFRNKCQALEENYTKTIALCDDLKQALLRKAFNGEL